MGRRRRRRPEDNQNNGHPTYVNDEGNVVHVRKIGAGDEGVLYTMQISVSSARCMQPSFQPIPYLIKSGSSPPTYIVKEAPTQIQSV
eukprot:scaffold45643_cov92-Cyclotella_meneghiniana.AAC.3